MSKIMKKAIQSRLDKGETQFYINPYWYECNINGMIRKREQRPGYTPTNDWERIGTWDPSTWEIID